MGRKNMKVRPAPEFSFFFSFKCDSLPQGKREKGSIGSRTWWCLPKCCDLQGNTEHNGRQQTNRGDAHKGVIHISTQVLVRVYLLSLAPPFIVKGQRPEEVLWNESFGYFSDVIPSEERYMGSREARGGNLGKGSCSPEVPPPCRVQSGATSPLPYLGVTATRGSPHPSRPGCEGLFLYFPPFGQVTPWLSAVVSISSLKLLSHTSTLLQGLCSSSFSRALAPSTNGFISSFIKKSFKRKAFPRALCTPHLYPAQCTEILVWKSIARSPWLNQGQNLSYALQVKAHIISVANRVGIGKALRKKDQADFNSLCPVTCKCAQN